MSAPIIIALPFTGLWLAQNSPARRVPSHGTDVWGERYAIDFVGVDARRRTSPFRDWRTLLATEPPERFFAFGRAILSPVDGTVVEAHDGEIDHEARRSQLALVPYALGQGARVRQGVEAIAGNFLIIKTSGDAFVALVHLRAGSLSVVPGDTVTTGQPIGACGNSGNSTQPHLHLQIMDSPDLALASGLPMRFRRYRESARGARHFEIRESGVPAEGAVVEPLPVAAADSGG